MDSDVNTDQERRKGKVTRIQHAIGTSCISHGVLKCPDSGDERE